VKAFVILVAVMGHWIATTPCRAGEPDDWTALFDEKMTDRWIVAGDAVVDPANPKNLIAQPGTGVLISTLTGKVQGQNLLTTRRYGPIRVHIEFLIPQDANAGVKLNGLYEIQLRDTFGNHPLTGGDCGGIYPRAEAHPHYHTIDEGVAPKVNATKPYGQWQTLDVVFHPPCFAEADQKIANARFDEVVLNGQVVHEKTEVEWPTGAAWRLEKEIACGPLFLQGDHGPVAYRNVRIEEILRRYRRQSRPNRIKARCREKSKVTDGRFFPTRQKSISIRSCPSSKFAKIF